MSTIETMSGWCSSGFHRWSKTKTSAPCPQTIDVGGPNVLHCTCRCHEDKMTKARYDKLKNPKPKTKTTARRKK